MRRIYYIIEFRGNKAGPAGNYPRFHLADISMKLKSDNGVNPNYYVQKFEMPNVGNILNRRDKMGFPVPLKEWFSGELRDFVLDTFSSASAKDRSFMNTEAVIKNFDNEAQFSRKAWGLLSLELWHQKFHDCASEWKI